MRPDILSIDGKRIARKGDMTSHGGMITTGASSVTVADGDILVVMGHDITSINDGKFRIYIDSADFMESCTDTLDVIGFYKDGEPTPDGLILEGLIDKFFYYKSNKKLSNPDLIAYSITSDLLLNLNLIANAST